ncbi:MAG: recombinase family protein [Ignavibacteriales bacterium]|nr:recombinase family protein [Ignavibacteriales bacterium]
MQTLKIAVGYVRCSTDMQEESIEQQRKSIEAWAQANHYKVINWYADEGKSGTSFNRRPAFMQMSKKVEGGANFEYILVYDESRWGRAGNPRENTYWKFHFERYGVKVRVINSQSKNENDIGSYVVEVVESAEASEYSKKLSRSTLRGCIDNANKGFSNGGTPPYGYKRIAVHKVTGERVRELLQGEHRRESEEKVVWGLGDEHETTIVKRIFELKVQGYGYRHIAETLNEEGIPCPQRGRWKNKNQKWSSVTIQTIIINPAYCGDRIYNRHPLSKKRIGEENILGKTKERWFGNEEEWITVKDAHPAIISRELFDKANRNRKNGTRRNQHHYESPYLLSGLVKCEHCGFNFQGQSYRATGHYYYVDGGNMNKGKSVCERTAIPRDRLENFIINLIKDSLPLSKVASRMEELASEYINNKGRKNIALDIIQKRIGENEARMQNLIRLVENGAELDTVLARIKQLEQEKSWLERERGKLETNAMASVDIKNVSASIAQFLLNFEKHFHNAPLQERKEMIRQIVLGVSVNPQKRIAKCTITKIPMVNRTLTALFNPSEFVGASCSGGRIHTLQMSWIC